MADAVNCSVSKAQIGPLLPAVGEGGTALTTVFSVTLLLPLAGSEVAAVTEVEFVIVPPLAGAVTVMVIAGAAATASEGRVQVTTAEPPQFQPTPAADTKVVPVGSVSVTETALALCGPELLTASV